MTQLWSSSLLEAQNVLKLLQLPEHVVLGADLNPLLDEL